MRGSERSEIDVKRRATSHRGLERVEHIQRGKVESLGESRATKTTLPLAKGIALTAHDMIPARCRLHLRARATMRRTMKAVMTAPTMTPAINGSTSGSVVVGRNDSMNRVARPIASSGR